MNHFHQETSTRSLNDGDGTLPIEKLQGKGVLKQSPTSITDCLIEVNQTSSGSQKKSLSEIRRSFDYKPPFMEDCNSLKTASTAAHSRANEGNIFFKDNSIEDILCATPDKGLGPGPIRKHSGDVIELDKFRLPRAFKNYYRLDSIPQKPERQKSKSLDSFILDEFDEATKNFCVSNDTLPTKPARQESRDLKSCWYLESVKTQISHLIISDFEDSGTGKTEEYRLKETMLCHHLKQDSLPPTKPERKESVGNIYD